ncbi:protein CONSERVED IN THE GREEN LINEAGE AND DIATOMS 27, chloroplastic [Selaginella moellendorffii]|uniref:protein CONSERVED IN THE GREEN LINEAGE AND DIATOMS 27, chloroplastic n=1 Tax=Selaginella moellendorffii TaxID=88036 RepID=UPI000D1C7153|nr:protein CONSERVED IN THE GREEN LINEAGE AND DIATOMS 27, chloroplastic [Selaginella moellendorffii]|eukprot:XP_024529832.1 protein CONSERVED IN THE GREEN LINEAGE AND DIATOMS 27, chloroplastic [Selaginella moellendorffii]
MKQQYLIAMPATVASLQLAALHRLRPRFFTGISVKEAFFGGRRARRDAALAVRATKKSSSGDNNGFNGNGKKVPRFGTPFPDGNSEIDSPVPWDQLPINEFNSLQESQYFSWAVESVWLYSMKIGGIAACCTVFLGWPVASLSVNPESDLLKCTLGALSGGLMGATLAALRLYLGWAHIGDRLFSVTVEYEETGWYDGQTWIKPPEVLARDRLVGAYTVKPALSRVRVTLIGLAVSLSICAALLFSIPETRSSLLLQKIQTQPPPPRSSIKGYSEKSARTYEPSAFVGPDEEFTRAPGVEDNGGVLPDLCT